MCICSALQVFLHVSRRVAAEAAEARKQSSSPEGNRHAAEVCPTSFTGARATEHGSQNSPAFRKSALKPRHSMNNCHTASTCSMAGKPCMLRIITDHNLPVTDHCLAQEAQHVADRDASSDEEAVEEAPRQQAPAPGEPEALPPVATDPAFEHSGRSLKSFV